MLDAQARTSTRVEPSATASSASLVVAQTDTVAALVQQTTVLASVSVDSKQAKTTPAQFQVRAPSQDCNLPVSKSRCQVALGAAPTVTLPCGEPVCCS